MEAAGDPQKAVNIWNDIIALTPNANAVASRGMCYIAMKKPRAAIRDADAALQVYSTVLMWCVVKSKP
jgi:hypothetical protein